MFGLGIEKIVIIGIIAAFLIGPEQLPVYAMRLREAVRAFRGFSSRIKSEIGETTGFPIDTADWNEQIQRYNPRSLLQEAWEQSSEAVQPAGPAHKDEGAQTIEPKQSTQSAKTFEQKSPAVTQSVPRRWKLFGGSSGHPKRIPVPTASEDLADSAG